MLNDKDGLRQKFVRYLVIRREEQVRSQVNPFWRWFATLTLLFCERSYRNPKD